MTLSDGAESSKSAAAWSARAKELAAWARDRLAVRTDVWGGYRPLAERGREYAAADGTRKRLGTPTTRPRLCDHGRVSLTLDVLERHFRGQLPEHVVGLHSTGPGNLCLAGALDLDHHGDTSTSAAVNLRAALHWYDVLAARGFRPLLVDSNGAGGYHLRVLFSERVPARMVYSFLRWLTRDHAGLGFAKRPETFPKQPELKTGQVGNWLRLPGRHHTRSFWSAVCDGRGGWLQGEEAAAFILGLAGDAPGLIPVEASQAAAAAPPPAPKSWPPRRSGRSAGGNLSSRIAAYAARLPNLGEGQGRTDVAFSFAAWMTRDLVLDDALALAWLSRWDAGNAPPLGSTRLAEIVADAQKYGRNAVGCGLLSPTHPLIRSRPGHSIISCTVEVR